MQVLARTTTHRRQYALFYPSATRVRSPNLTPHSHFGGFRQKAGDASRTPRHPLCPATIQNWNRAANCSRRIEVPSCSEYVP